ncbi:FAD-dependent oxidoreductase [Candidatus Blochmannia ocreatus (nom. nud.)]|uniref:FAD-dependent oxidoreductase n=1 Tax=Candidatus Blochmannia ocreatus (nom. nud.) TaxID=251538 RepID=A0ABY4SZK3_9ENTR|nr:FAD-dependent oxidoreductase [Candidatus Blochmannia ocreatus]URJ25377.1 FAD-dependent oxidoreductase [Candidatus Blochmannia ocreatus]
MNKLFCDVLIFGAGIIGASLALQLSKSGIKVIIIERHHLAPIKKQPLTRIAAINYSSAKFLKTFNIWEKISSALYTSYNQLETWEWKSSKVTFQASYAGISTMGYIVENIRLQSALWENLISQTIKLFCPSTLVSISYNNNAWKSILDNRQIIISKILVGADGIHSQIRKQLGIGIMGWKYQQCCMLITIKTFFKKSETIWQIFSPYGPIGFLPLYNGWGSLMWYNTPEQIYSLQKLPRRILEKIIKYNFHEQLGNYVKIYNITVVPLISQRAYKYTTPLGGVLVGDSAHSLHPLAGQGINLGLRDVISLSKLLITNVRVFEEHSSIEEILHNYQNTRKYDTFLMQSSIDMLYLIFHNNYFPIKIARNIAFMIVERSKFLKKQILKYALGL